MNKVKYLLVSVMAMVLSTYSFSQEPAFPKLPETNDTIVSVVDKPAQFPGGNVAWIRYQQRNFHFEFDSATTLFSNPTIIASFIVHKDGKLSGIIIKNPKEGRSKVEAAYLKLIKEGPNWIAAKKNGENVTSRMNWLITICLREE